MNLKKKFITKKSLGQNFISNPKILESMVKAGGVDKKDIVVEVGPGQGTLTDYLIKSANQVIAIEKDSRLIESLNNKYKLDKNIKIIENDALTFNPQEFNLKPNQYKIIANIPYYITSYFIRKVLEEWPAPKLIVLMVQKEVAQRIMAEPPDSSILSISTQLYVEPKIISYVSKNNFKPKPKVDSAIILLTPKTQTMTRGETSLFLDFVKTGFSSKRKILAGNLAKGLNIDRDFIDHEVKKIIGDEKCRAENLELQDWLSLFKSIDLNK